MLFFWRNRTNGLVEKENEYTREARQPAFGKSKINKCKTSKEKNSTCKIFWIKHIAWHMSQVIWLPNFQTIATWKKNMFNCVTVLLYLWRQ
jgi:hypothetical protein